MDETCDDVLIALSAKLIGLEARVGDPALSLDDQSNLEKSCSAIKAAIESRKTLAEIKKLNAETSNLARVARSEGTRFWISVIAPLIGAAAIVATLMFQIHQFNENSKLTRLNSEGTQFRELIKSTPMPGDLAAVTNIALLRTFVKSETYGEQARIAQISMMPSIQSREGFREMFVSVFPKIQYPDLPELVRLSRMQNEFITGAISQRDKAEDLLKKARLQGRQDEPISLPPEAMKEAGMSASSVPSTPQSLVESIKSDINGMQDNIGVTSAGIAKALRQRTHGSVPDLSEAILWGADLSGIDFGSALLANTDVENSDVTDTSLGGVTQFTGGNWSFTPWWRAKRLSPDLLRYLQEKFPYDSSIPYFGKEPEPGEYEREVARLSSQN